MDRYQNDVQQDRSTDKRALIDKITSQAVALAKLDPAVDAAFAATERQIQSKELPEVIRQRLMNFEKQFKARRAQFKTKVQTLFLAD